MALGHADVGTALSKSEWESTSSGAHTINGQQAGDLIYASTTTELARLEVGTTNGDVLTSNGTLPVWATSVAKITVTDNEATDEDNLITFVAGAASTTGAQALEMDGNLYYNPSSGTLGATTYKVGSDTLAEYIADTVGAMVGSGTETRIAVSYDDSDNTLDFVVDDMTANDNTTYTHTWVDSSADAILRLSPSTGSNDDLTLVAGTNITLTPSGDDLTITAASAGTPGDITLNSTAETTTYVVLSEGATGTQALKTDAGITYNASTNVLTASGFAGALTGNSSTTTALASAVNIGGVSFDGTGNIDLPGVNSAGNQATTGNAATATKFAATANIGGVAFDGSGNIDLPGVNTAGNQNTSGNAATATALATARAINGTDFDGTAPITITAAGSTLSDTVTIAKGGTGATTASPGFDALSPLTTAGDILYGGASGTGTRLAKPGTPAGEVLTFASGATAPSWVAAGGGGGSVSLVVNTGDTITTGQAVGIDSNGKAIPYTQTGADYTGIIPYRTAADVTANLYPIHLQVAYDTATDIHIAVFSKAEYSGGAWSYIADAKIYAVPFEIGADDTITWGTEREIADEMSYYGRQKVVFCEATETFLACWLDSSGYDLNGVLLKPVAGSPTTIYATTVFEVSGSTYSTLPALADMSDDSNDVVGVFHQSAGYKPQCTLMDIGAWDGSSNGAAHGVTGITDNELDSSNNSYNNPGGDWVRSVKTGTGAGNRQCIGYFYYGVYGFDISGTTAYRAQRTYTTNPSNRGPTIVNYAGTAGEAHAYIDSSSSSDYLNRLVISTADNTVALGAYANGLNSQVGGGGSSGAHGMAMQYYGTQDKFVTVTQRQYGSFQYSYMPAGNAGFAPGTLTVQTYYMWDGGDGGNRLYGGGTTGGAPGDYDYYESSMTLNRRQGQYAYVQLMESMSSCYNEDRNRIVVATMYAGWDATYSIPETAGYPAAGIFLIKSNTGMDDKGVTPAFLGFCNESGSVTGNGSLTVEVTIGGGTNERQLSLITGQKYFLDSWGTLNPYGPLHISEANIYAGVALSATELLVDGKDASAEYYHVGPN